MHVVTPKEAAKSAMSDLERTSRPVTYSAGVMEGRQIPEGTFDEFVTECEALGMQVLTWWSGELALISKRRRMTEETATLTGRTLKGSYISAVHASGMKHDVPTGLRVTVEVDGVEYERTVMERWVWRDTKPSKLLARFVLINNVRYEVEL